jgi:sugar phosphate isomerase/epimerase
MKLGVNTYSWLWNDSLENAVRAIGESGYFTGIEFLVSPPHFYLSEYRPGMYKELKKIIEGYGMEVLSVNIPSLDINIASPFPEMRVMTIDLYKRLSIVAEELGAKILLIVPGKRHPLLPPDFDLIYSYARDSVQQVIDYTKYTDLTIGIETLPSKFIDTLAQLRDFVRDFNDRRVKIVFDAANVFTYEDPAQALKTVGDDLCLLHLSDTKTTKWEHSVLGTGDLDSKSFVQSAIEIGYNGYLVLEIINDRGIDGIKESIEFLKMQGLEI